MTNSNSTQTRTLKVEILEKNRCTISMHDIKPYDRQKFDYTKNKDKIMGIYMRTRSYVRNLKSFHKTLFLPVASNEFISILRLSRSLIKSLDLDWSINL